MNLHPLSPSEEASWHEKVRRRELRRSAAAIHHLAEKIELTEDFASGTPKTLAKLIGTTADLLAQRIDSRVPAHDLEQLNTVLGIIAAHLRYVERARVAQTPWSIVQSAERLLKLAANTKSHFIVRPTWSYNYSIVGEFVGTYRDFLSCWSWFPIQEWESKIGLASDESIYCISFPRIERNNLLLHANWGHEVGHILAAKWIDKEFGSHWVTDEPAIRKRIEDHVSNNQPPVDPLFKAYEMQNAVAKLMRATMAAARQGLVELLCDHIGIHLFGPAALAASMEFAARFAMDVSPLEANNYPPWRYRLRKMIEYCMPDLEEHAGLGYPSADLLHLVEWLRTGQRLAAGTSDLHLLQSNVVAEEAYAFIESHWDLAAQATTALLPPALSMPYRLHENHGTLSVLMERLQNGVPPNEIEYLAKQPASFQDILSAAWAHKIRQMAASANWGTPEDYDLLFRLVLKACECSYVHAEWGPRLAGRET